jgi:hypothetical protein
VPGNFDETAMITVAGPTLTPLTHVFIVFPLLRAVLLARESPHSIHVAALARRRNPWLSTALPGS